MAKEQDEVAFTGEEEEVLFEVKARGRMEGRVVELRGVERNGERRRDAEVNISIVLFFT